MSTNLPSTEENTIQTYNAKDAKIVIDFGHEEIKFAIFYKDGSEYKNSVVANLVFDKGELDVKSDDLNSAVNDQYYSISSISRILGKRFDEMSLKQLNQELQYEVLNDRLMNNRPLVKIKTGETELKLKPETVVSKMLNKVREIILNQLGVAIEENLKLECSIAYPSDFDQNQKEALKQAAIIANFTVVEMVESSIATILSLPQVQSNVSYDKKQQFLLIQQEYQCASVTIIAKDGTEFTTHISRCSYKAGIESYDFHLAKELSNEINVKRNYDVYENRKINQLPWNLLKFNCAEARKQLKTSQSYKIHIQNLYNNISFSHIINKEEYERISKSVTDEILQEISNMLDGINISKIVKSGNIVLCGFEEYEDIKQSILHILDIPEEKCIYVNSSTPVIDGIKYQNENNEIISIPLTLKIPIGFKNVKGQLCKILDASPENPLIYPIGTTGSLMSHTSYEGQKACLIQFYEGFHELADNPQNCYIGKVIHTFDKSYPEGHKLEVKIVHGERIDGDITVYTIDPEMPQLKQMHKIKRKYALTEEEMIEERKLTPELAEEEKLIIERNDSRYCYLKLLLRIKSILQSQKKSQRIENAANLLNEVEEQYRWAKTHKEESIEIYRKKRKRALKHFKPVIEEMKRERKK